MVWSWSIPACSVPLSNAMPLIDTKMSPSMTSVDNDDRVTWHPYTCVIGNDGSNKLNCTGKTCKPRLRWSGNTTSNTTAVDVAMISCSLVRTN
jgi:hypothetical protein